VYAELKRLARSRLSMSGRGVILDTTSLVHESFIRLEGAGKVSFADRDHFMAYAASAMRSVVVDYLRRKLADRRGGGVDAITLNTGISESVAATDTEILEVNDALESLRKINERLVKVVEMRYFAGLSDEEIARALDVSVKTVGRDWVKARALLAGLLGR
jgi:RNA polymerase sigma factor (TIGR02999 family)